MSGYGTPGNLGTLGHVTSGLSDGASSPSTGKHAGPLSTEDAPSLNIAAGESWWRPRHRAEDAKS